LNSSDKTHILQRIDDAIKNEPSRAKKKQLRSIKQELAAKTTPFGKDNRFFRESSQSLTFSLIRFYNEQLFLSLAKQSRQADYIPSFPTDLVFLDKSAREMAFLIREFWKQLESRGDFVENPLQKPREWFINVGQEKWSDITFPELIYANYAELFPKQAHTLAALICDDFRGTGASLMKACTIFDEALIEASSANSVAVFGFQPPPWWQTEQFVVDSPYSQWHFNSIGYWLSKHFSSQERLEILEAYHRAPNFTVFWSWLEGELPSTIPALPEKISHEILEKYFKTTGGFTCEARSRLSDLQETNDPIYFLEWLTRQNIKRRRQAMALMIQDVLQHLQLEWIPE